LKETPVKSVVSACVPFFGGDNFRVKERYKKVVKAVQGQKNIKRSENERQNVVFIESNL
jgi:hypothetical protein